MSPDTPDRFGETPLNLAAAFNQTGAVEILLDSHANPNPPVRTHKDQPQPPATPLQYAAEIGNRRIAFLLIHAGAHIDEKGPTGRTALFYADGHLDLLKLLLNEGADANVRDEEGASPLDNAVWYGLLDAAAILLAHGAHIDEAETETGATPINEAAFRGNKSQVQFLLRLHPNLDAPDNKGYAPLQNAARMKKDQVAVLLLDAETKERLTPQLLASTVETAIKNDEPALLEALIQHGAPVSGASLDLAALTGADGVIAILFKHNADPNIDAPNGASPLEDACLKGFASTAAQLLDHGALVNRLNRASGTTALYSAASFGRSEVVKLLLQKGASANLCGKNQKTPYQVALENGYNDFAVQIQAHGASNTCAH